MNCTSRPIHKLRGVSSAARTRGDKVQPGLLTLYNFMKDMENQAKKAANGPQAIRKQGMPRPLLYQL